MKRSVISTPNAPAAIGPYSQAIRLDHLVFVSGQIPIDPATGALIEGEVDALTRRVMDNIRAILEAAGSSMDRVVKTTIYLQNMNDFAAVNSVYAEYFTDDPPARATVAVSTLPKGVRLEIDAIASVE